LEGEKHNQSSKPSACIIAHAAEISSAVFLEPIFKRNQRIDFAKPAIGATMTPASSTILRASII
jgi:hypothetical protein